MAHSFLLCSLFVAAAIFSAVMFAPPAVGQMCNDNSYGLYFMNITSDRKQQCIFQLFGSAVNITPVIVQANNSSFNQFQSVLTGISSTQNYNFTPQDNQIFNGTDPYIPTSAISNFGIVVSSKGGSIYMQGIKSDLGSTDGYTALPVTDSCTEFIIAAWPQQSDFLSEIFVVASLDSTCVEIYVIYGGTRYVKIAGGSINKFQVYRYYAQNVTTLENGTVLETGEDVTGYFVNTTQPANVYYGHECAWVPDDSIFFCDHMAEQMPPRCQLGTIYIVPPIYGRETTAGYLIRVVPAYNTTTVSYLGTSASVQLGSFIQINQPITSIATVIQCSAPCLVMQYNKGMMAAPHDVETDPFMMLVVPVDHFTAGAGFGTANFCDGPQSLVGFTDFLCVVTYPAYAANIQLDGGPILNDFGIWTPDWQTVTGADGSTWWYVCSNVGHGFHTVNNAPNTEGSFAVYGYGHSYEEDSSSAYGFSVNYNITGNPVCDNWIAAQPIIANLSGMQPSGPGVAACQSDGVETGSNVLNSPNGYAPFPFTLSAAIAPPASLDSSTCWPAYDAELLQLLQSFSKLINYWICTTQNCSNLGGVGVAIDYSSLLVNWIGTNNVYTSVQINVNMIATMSTSAQNFAQCRADIMHYMTYFINWPPAYNPNLLATPSGTSCPPISFQQPQYSALAAQCPAYSTVPQEGF